MKAVAFREHGSADVLRVEDLPQPEPGPGEIRVRVAATALNHLDIWIREGLPTLKVEMPHILGADIAGTVDALGAGAVGPEVGAAVVVAPGLSCGRCRACSLGRDHHCRGYSILGEHRNGGYAEYVVVPDRNVLPAPSGLPLTDAAAFPLTFLTSWHMLMARAELKEGESVLVQGAGSGVGTAAVQIAKLIGAYPIVVTAGSDEKLELLKGLGADHGINYRTDDFLKAVKDITAKRGVDVVFDHVGESVWEKNIRALTWGGRLVTCGATSGHEGKTDLRHLFYRKLSLLGSTMGSRGELFDIIRHVEAGRLKPVVHTVLPLEKAADAHRLLEERKAFGKVVLTP